MNDGPILIVDTDIDDRELLQHAWDELEFKNPLIFFDDGESVLEYLNSKKQTPFIILSDVNLPKMNGFELKKKLLEHDDTFYKSVPFIFWSTSASEAQIKRSYDLGGNGFFIKENNFEALKQSLIEIASYWTKSKIPQ